MMINQIPAELVDGKTEQEILQVENLYWSDMYEALERLEKSEDFRRVVLDGYFKDKAINGVSMLATDYVKRNGFRSDIMESLIAISHLQDYFIVIKSLGSAPEELEDEE
ncbi:MAG: hypothetical protein ACYDD5_00670 [Sulfuricurvum sp.]